MTTNLNSEPEPAPAGPATAPSGLGGLAALDRYLDNDEHLMAAAWHPVARSGDLDGAEPLATQLLGIRVVLVRDGGQARLLAHGQPAAVGPPGPARPLVERYGLVWLGPDPRVADASAAPGLPRLPEYENGDLDYQVLRRRTSASAGVLIDNFLDVTHFSYLHRRTFGLVAPVTVEHYQVTSDRDGMRLVHETLLNTSTDRGIATGEADLPGELRRATYTYLIPYLTHLRMEFPRGGPPAASSTLACQPESATSTTAYVIVGWPAGDPEGLRRQVELSAAVLDEDIAMLERLADPRLPLDLREELHTRADRASVQMRRVLRTWLSGAARAEPTSAPRG